MTYGHTQHSTSRSGECTLSYAAVVASLKGLCDLEQVRVTYGDRGTTDHSYDAVFARGRPATTLVTLHREHNTPKMSMSITAADADIYAKLNRWCDEHLLIPPKKGVVRFLTTGRNGLETIESSAVGVPFIADNYTPDVAEAVPSLIANFRAPAPSGRLTIIDGPYGTGKTTLLRSIMNDIDAVHLMVPSGMAESLTGPALVQLLSSIAEADKPTVLYIEDADEILQPRDRGNITAISALLNLTDGIIGQSLRVHVVCTTNTRIDQIDGAIVRSMRLAAHLHCGLLPVEQARRVLRRLNPSATLPGVGATPARTVGFAAGVGATAEYTGGYALADLYKAAVAQEGNSGA